ncbi:MAG: Hsp20/alpha crystallin family protein [Clostridiales bacterium]|nr:Hsp20/alpha crystallin family protein [Clostridiales bacterium]
MFGLSPFEKKSYELFNAFHDFEHDFFGSELTIGSFKTDIKDEGDKYILEAEMPGFDKEDISLEIDEEFLLLKAEHSQEKKEEDKNGNFIRRERSTGTYQRCFNISEIDADSIKATYANGILTLVLPKKTHEGKTTKRLIIE